MSTSRPLLEEVLPRFDANEVHDVWVAAAPHVVFAAVRQVTVREVRLLRPLEAVRALPSLLMRRPSVRPRGSAALLDEFTEGVVPQGERPGPRSPREPSAASGVWPATSRQRCGPSRSSSHSWSPDTRKRRLRSLSVQNGAAAASSPRPASRALAPTRRERCCVIGVRSGSGAARFAGVGSPQSAAVRFVSGIRTSTLGHVWLTVC
jgi:hypothetical protein